MGGMGEIKFSFFGTYGGVKPPPIVSSSKIKLA